MFIPWRPTKEEIERWFKTKELEFAQQNNKDPIVTPHKYLEKYVFIDMHEVFFVIFHTYCRSGY
jgi:hypothetical protein